MPAKLGVKANDAAVFSVIPPALKAVINSDDRVGSAVFLVAPVGALSRLRKRSSFNGFINGGKISFL